MRQYARLALSAACAVCLHSVPAKAAWFSGQAFQPAQPSVRTVRFKGGVVRVEREANNDHITVTNDSGERESESQCPIQLASYDELVRFFESFVRAVDVRDMRMVASLARYPLQVNGASSIRIAGAPELIQQYERVFSSDVLEKIRRAVPVRVFCRNGSAMIGNGVIWVSGRQGHVALDVVNR